MNEEDFKQDSTPLQMGLLGFIVAMVGSMATFYLLSIPLALIALSALIFPGPRAIKSVAAGALTGIAICCLLFLLNTLSH